MRGRALDMARGVMALLLVQVLLAGLAGNVLAGGRRADVTPYGANCSLCGEYAHCDRQPTREEAVNALKSYYGKRMMNVIVLKQELKYIEVGVYRNGELVDRVLLDLRTGRIRSMY